MRSGPLPPARPGSVCVCVCSLRLHASPGITESASGSEQPLQNSPLVPQGGHSSVQQALGAGFTAANTDTASPVGLHRGTRARASPDCAELPGLNTPQPQGPFPIPALVPANHSAKSTAAAAAGECSTGAFIQPPKLSGAEWAPPCRESRMLCMPGLAGVTFGSLGCQELLCSLGSQGEALRDS